MRIETEESTFCPVKIILEQKKEMDALIDCLGHVSFLGKNNEYRTYCMALCTRLINELTNSR